MMKLMLHNERLEKCHKFIKEACYMVAMKKSFAVIEGARSQQMQDVYFVQGKTRLRGDDKRAKHVINQYRDVAHAVDVVPLYGPKDLVLFPDKFIDLGVSSDYSVGLRKQNIIKACKIYAEFAILAQLFIQAGSDLSKEDLEFAGLGFRWGGDWDGDYMLSDNEFNDLPHIEITGL